MFDCDLETNSDLSCEDTLNEAFLYYLSAYDDIHACFESASYVDRSLMG